MKHDKLLTALKKPRLVFPYLVAKINSELLSRFTAYSLPPRVIHIAVNNYCNSRCAMCDFGLRNKAGVHYKVMRSHVKEDSDIDIGLYKKLVSDVKSFKPILSFKLVEPLLNKDVLELIKIGKQNGLYVELTTNGLLLPLLAENLVKVGLDEIQVSIDGLSEVNYRIRRVHSFEKAIEGIRLLHKYGKKYNKKVYVKINYAITNLNYDCIMDTLEYFRTVEGVDAVKLQNLSFVSDKMKNVHNAVLKDYCVSTLSSVSDIIDPKKVDINILYEQIKKVKKTKYPFVVKLIPNILYTLENLDQFFNDELTFMKGHTKCMLPYRSAYVDIKGDVRPHTRCYDIVLGNIKKESFMKIWNGKKYHEFRAKIRKRAFPACARCCGVIFNNV